MRKVTFEMPDKVWKKVSKLIGPEKKYRHKTTFLNDAVLSELEKNGIKIE